MKTALITGASSAIGAAMVQQLLLGGYVVYAGAHRTEKLASLAASGAIPVCLDVADEESMITAIDIIKAKSGRLDVLVNNESHCSFGALEDMPPEEGRRHFEINVFGLARLTQLALPMMRLQHSGTIVNVCAVGGKNHEPFGSWYHASKGAVKAMSGCLRMELAPFGIKVIVIEPGDVKTELSKIARENLLRYSGEGSYGNQANAYAYLMESAETTAATPATVASTLVQAMAAWNS